MYESYKDYLLHNSTLLNQVESGHALELVLGTLSIINNTSFINQDYAIYCVYSTLDIFNAVLNQTQSSRDMILVSESTLRIESLHAIEISPKTNDKRQKKFC